MLSSCFLNDKNQIYIVTSNQDAYYVEPIKIFNLKGKIIKKINKSNNSVNFIDIYYDTKNSKIYILVCNDDNVKSYDYKNNKIYKIYGENYRERYSTDIPIPKEDIYPDYLIMNNKEELIELNTDGNIRIWNFHSAMLLKIINLDIEYQLKSFCLWNNEYLFVAKDKSICLVKFKNSKIIKILNGHNNQITYIIKINHSKYGESLISQGSENDGIKLWTNKNIIRL